MEALPGGPLPSVSLSSVCKQIINNKFKLINKKRIKINELKEKLNEQRKLWIHLSEDLQDDGIRCDVCANADTSPDDAIVLCDGCDAAVHQSCYNVGPLPDGEWFCEYCKEERRSKQEIHKLNLIRQRQDLTKEQKEAEAAALLQRAESNGIDIPPLPRSCVLCPRRGGALIRTTEGLWGHLSCGIWLPECYVLNSRIICGVHTLHNSRFSSFCCICLLNNFPSIQCSFNKCNTSFHPICALFAAFGMNITDQINIQRKNNDVTFHGFCLRHRLCSHTRTAPIETPLEFRRDSPDLSSPLYQGAMLIRRNRDILLHIEQLQSEDSLWAGRLSSYLLKELADNIRCLRILWGNIERPLKGAPLKKGTVVGGPPHQLELGKGEKKEKRKLIIKDNNHKHKRKSIKNN